MTGYEFALVDVFADSPLTGNPLAVVRPFGEATDHVDADDLGPRLACEFQQSETTLLLPPSLPGADWRLRSWTAAGHEVVGAGHNALGAWWFLAERGLATPGGTEREAVQELGGRTLPVGIDRDGDRLRQVRLTQGPAVRGASLPDATALAAALSLEAADLDGVPVVMSTGAPHLLVPLRDRAALDRVRTDPVRLLPVLQVLGAQGCYPYTTEPAPDGRVASARFANPTAGISEDPATGSAAGPLAAHLVATSMAPAGADLHIVQGERVGRPSRISVRVDRDVVSIAGHCVTVATGTLRLPGPGSRQCAEPTFNMIGERA